MYTWAAKNDANLQEADLYRCIHRRFLFPDELRRSIIGRLRRYGLSELNATHVFESTKKYLLNLTTEQMIRFHVNYPFRSIPSFVTGGRGVYAAGRFNDETFPALYAAEDEDTSVEEGWHRVRQQGCRVFQYVVFSVAVSGKVADVRPAIDQGIWEFPDAYAPCQAVGGYIRGQGFIGLLAYSKRKTGGTCCALFAEDRIFIGTIVTADTKALH